MANSISSRIKHAWNAFMNKDPTITKTYSRSYYSRPDRYTLSRGNEKSIVGAVINRIAIDAASIDIKHIKTDADGRYLADINSSLNECLNLEANIDQTGRAFRQDIVMSMLDEGVIAVVPTDTDDNPNDTGSYSIEEMRVGKITQWFPSWVKVLLYNERTGNKEEISIKKSNVAIIENPLFSVMNEPNSVQQRLVRKLNLLDAVDEASSSGKLDMIIQLPYVIKTDLQREQAEKRRKDIESQLENSKYGIAYTDGTERIVQLNRAVENNLMSQIEFLTSMLYSQLGITQSILDGTADETTLNNYYSRSIEPILSAIVDEFKRKFLTKTARTQHQTIQFFRNPFKLIPISDIAEIADKFTRNEILSSNEVRQIVGFKPSKDPKADELINSNINQAGAEEMDMLAEEEMDDVGMTEDEYMQHKQELDELDEELNELESKLK